MKPELVREARREELKFVRNRRVYEIVPWSRALERTGTPPIKTRWVDTNKGKRRGSRVPLQVGCTRVPDRS